jgi:hypothetical protein
LQEESDKMMSLLLWVQLQESAETHAMILFRSDIQLLNHLVLVGLFESAFSLYLGDKSFLALSQLTEGDNAAKIQRQVSDLANLF